MSSFDLTLKRKTEKQKSFENIYLSNMEQSNRYWSTTFHHKYPWQTIACAYWKKYPNPESNHVYSEDMIDVQVSF